MGMMKGLAGGIAGSLALLATAVLEPSAALTANAPFTLKQTWNNAGVVFTALKVNVTDTASNALSLLLDLQVGGATKFSVTKSGVLLSPGDGSGSIGTSSARWGSGWFFTSINAVGDSATVTLGASSDVILARDAANTLAQRNGTNAQTTNIYGTWTDASNLVRIRMGANSINAFIYPEGIGTGLGANNLYIGPVSGTGGVVFQTGAAVERWKIDTNGHFIAPTDNAYDIGAAGATRPRTGYLGTSLVVGANSTTLNNGSLSFGGSADSYLYFPGGGYIQAVSTGVFKIMAVDASSFGRLQLGGTTSSFPSLKRSTTELHARLADDSADGGFQALHYKVAGTQVVGARVIDARSDDVANSGDATTDGLIDALRDAMVTHGLIAAA